MATVVTITGASGHVNSVTLNSDETASLARTIANIINSAATLETLNAVNFPGPFGAPGPGVSEQVVTVGSGSGPYVGTAGWQYIVNAETVPVSVTAAANQTVLSGTGGGVFNLAGGNMLDLGGGNSAVSLSGAANGVYLADGNNTILGGSETNSTISAGTGNATLFGSSGSQNQFFFSSGNTEYIGGSGTDSLIAGSGAATVYGGTGNTTLFGGSGTVDLVGGSGSITFVSGTGPSTVTGGAQGATLFGSSGSDITYNGTQGALYVAGLGNETLDAATSRANSVLYGAQATGAATLIGGSGADTLVGTAGSTQMTGGSGADVFAFFHGNSGGANVIGNFSNQDLVLLSGYAPNGIASSVSAGGSTTVTLTDNTTITFQGVASLNPNQIVTT